MDDHAHGFGRDHDDGEHQPMLQPYDQSRSGARNSRFAVVGVFAFVVIAIVVIMLVHVS
jgi:hypothetical protein